MEYKWEIRRVTRVSLVHGVKTERLGYVFASSQPQALLKAFERWPALTDWRKAQAGFYALAVN